MTPAQKDQLVNAVLSSREFCGDQNEALADAAADLGLKLTAQQRGEVFMEASERWNSYRQEAGVASVY